MKLYVCYGTWRKARPRLTGNYSVPVMVADNGNGGRPRSEAP